MKDCPFLTATFEWLTLSRGTDVMHGYCHVTEILITYVITIVTWLLGGALDQALGREVHLDMTARSLLPTEPSAPGEGTCCSGVLGYASDNLSLNYPCQKQPCCNSSDTATVVAIDFAMGFRFQCMPRKNVQPLCYETGAEVRTTNQDPDFIPRACCQGAKFKVLVNQWYAAMVVKCVEENDDQHS